MARRARRTRTLLMMGAGAALQYFLDPERGRSRRVQARQQLQSKLRRTERRAEGEAEYLGDRVRGVRYRAGHPDQAPEDDRTLVDKVRSEVLGLQEFRMVVVNVDAVDGVVSLRGQLEDETTIRDLERAVGNVTGVSGVRSYLHTPGQPVPSTPR
jgi:hypothetical protein